MKQFLAFIFVALLLISILLFIYNPEALENIWLWIVGLIGPIIAALRNGAESLSRLFVKPGKPAVVTSPNQEPKVKSNAPAPNLPVAPTTLTQKEKQKVVPANMDTQLLPHDDYQGTTLTVIRYYSDELSTLGLLYINDKFRCYTLEDAHHDEKIPNQTRIPAGTYPISYNRVETGLTLKYRKTRPWFKYHIHIRNVPNYRGVYIHNGSTHEHTDGCLLVADSINASSEQNLIYNSKKTFEQFYKELKPLLEADKPVRIRILDEDWFEKLNLKNTIQFDER